VQFVIEIHQKPPCQRKGKIERNLSPTAAYTLPCRATLSAAPAARRQLRLPATPARMFAKLGRRQRQQHTQQHKLTVRPAEERGGDTHRVGYGQHLLGGAVQMGKQITATDASSRSSSRLMRGKVSPHLTTTSAQSTSRRFTSTVIGH